MFIAYVHISAIENYACLLCIFHSFHAQVEAEAVEVSFSFHLDFLHFRLIIFKYMPLPLYIITLLIHVSICLYMAILSHSGQIPSLKCLHAVLIITDNTVIKQ